MSRLSVRGVVSDGREGTVAEEATCMGWGETVRGWPGPQTPGSRAQNPGSRAGTVLGAQMACGRSLFTGGEGFMGKPSLEGSFRWGHIWGLCIKWGNPGGAHGRQPREDWVGRGTDEEQEQAAAGMTLELPCAECPVTAAAFGGLYLRDIPRCTAQGD